MINIKNESITDFVKFIDVLKEFCQFQIDNEGLGFDKQRTYYRAQLAREILEMLNKKLG